MCFFTNSNKNTAPFSDLFIFLYFKKVIVGFSSITHGHTCMCYRTLFVIFVHYCIHLFKGNKIFKSDNITFNFKYFAAILLSYLPSSSLLEDLTYYPYNLYTQIYIFRSLFETNCFIYLLHILLSQYMHIKLCII